MQMVNGVQKTNEKRSIHLSHFGPYKKFSQLVQKIPVIPVKHSQSPAELQVPFPPHVMLAMQSTGCC